MERYTTQKNNHKIIKMIDLKPGEVGLIADSPVHNGKLVQRTLDILVAISGANIENLYWRLSDDPANLSAMNVIPLKSLELIYIL